MRISARFAVPALLAFVSAGCITSETLIRLAADRTGTIEQVLLINTRAVDRLPGLVADMFGGDAKVSSSKTSGVPDVFDEEQLRAEAAKLGEGVRFESIERLVRGDLEGARVTYRFDDVNELAVEQDPSSGMLGRAASAPGEGGKLAFEAVPQADGTTRLTVRFSESAPGKETSRKSSSASKDSMPKEMEAVLREMFNDFRVAIDVEVDGSIVSTSSPFVEGSRVTVLELDLGRLLQNADGFEALARVSPDASVSEMIPLMKDVEGIKVNESPLTVVFTGR